MSTSQPKPLREWYPLESSPQVFTLLAESWGVDTEKYSFLDIFSLDHQDLEHINVPCHAVILLFPDTPEIVAMRHREQCLDPRYTDLAWIPQVDVGHACGTFALVHALSATNLAPALAPFYQAVRQTPPDSRTALFASSREIYEGHHAVITAGQTEIRESDWEECDHFISFVYGNVNGETRVIEMDGVPPRSGPLDRGPASGSLLKDVADIVKQRYLPLAGDNIHFSMIALIG